MTVEQRIAADPRYRALVRMRQRFAWTLCAVTAVFYGTFIVFIAFDRAALTRPIHSGFTTVAVAAGGVMLMLPILICAAYVTRANRDFDRRLRDVLEDARA